MSPLKGSRWSPQASRKQHDQRTHRIEFKVHTYGYVADSFVSQPGLDLGVDALRVDPELPEPTRIVGD
jgi:hypothetical protein